MTNRQPRDLVASVRQRLMNLSRERGDDFQLVLTRYGLERLLYRLAQSPHAGQFVLKGAALFQLWTGQAHRSTRDLDLLGQGDPSPDRLRQVFQEVCSLTVDNDGLTFLTDAIQAEPIKEDDEYQGIRLRIEARLGNARLPLQIDVGFGDAITPGPQAVTYPTLLDFPAPQMNAYPRETVVAEKFQAMVQLGIANSRMKDFYDVWTLARQFEFNNTPDMWVRSNEAFPPVVSSEAFFTARGILQERARRLTDEEMLARLKSLIQRHAQLSGHLIDAADDAPSSAAYRSRFGSLLQAYRLAGYEPERDFRYVEINRDLRALYPRLVADVMRRLDAVGAKVTRDATSDLLLINGEFSASMVLSRCRETPAGSLRWLIQLDRRVAPDITILVRMDAANSQPTDYYLLPIMDIDAPRLLLCETNGVHLDTYQFDNLDYLAGMACRTKLEDVA